MSSLSEFCTEFGVDAPSLGHLTQHRRSWFLTRPEDDTILVHLDKHLFAAGILLGTEHRGFTPTPALIELIAKRSPNKVTVDEKGAWLFLCGRDLFRKALVGDARPTRTGLVLVQNGRDENLGYGKFGSGQVAVKNVLDRGFYLRRERSPQRV